jgi:hypothetical protein
MKEALENKQHCSAAFLDITQLFDKLWHTTLVYQLRFSLPLNHFIILKSCLQNRYFLVKIVNEFTELFPIHAEITKGIVLRTLLYLLFTTDFPTSSETTSATFADDTAVLATDNNPTTSSSKLLSNLIAVESWSIKWSVKAKESKSTHVTFTTRRETYPAVHINKIQLPQVENVKYLGLHINRRLTWHKHIFTKRKQ